MAASIPWLDRTLQDEGVDVSQVAELLPALALLALFVVAAFFVRTWVPAAPDVAPQLGQTDVNFSLQSSAVHAYEKLPLTLSENKGGIEKREDGMRRGFTKETHEQLLDLRFLGARSNVSLERGPPGQPVFSTRRSDTGR
jgi:hypothetical protein